MSEPTAQPRRRHRYWWGVGVVAFLAVGMVAYLAWSAWGASNDLRAAQTDAISLQQALLNGEQEVADQALRSFASHTDSARGRTSGPVWAAATKLPWLGESFKATRLVSWSASEAGRQAHVALFGDDNRDLLADLAPRDGQIDLAVIDELDPLLARLQRSLATSTAKLGQIKEDRLLGMVRGPFMEFRDHLLGAKTLTSGAHRATQVLPELLGQERPQFILLRFENNAEVRSTGGLPGAWAVIRAQQGALEIVEQGSTADFPEFAEPVVELTPTEERLWGVQPSIFFHDTNFIPDFPRSAQITRAMWDHRETHQDLGRDRIELDAIVEVDAVTLSYLLRATGPIQLADTEIELTAENAIDELLNRTYFRLPGKVDQDMFFAQAAAEIFDHLAAGVASPAELMRALSQAVQEKRVRVHSFHPHLQTKLSGARIASEQRFAADSPPQLEIYLNDGTGSKLSYYTRTKLSTKVAQCEDGSVVYRPTVTITQGDFEAEKLPRYITGGGSDGAEVGQQWVTFTIYGPVGGDLGRLRIDGERVAANVIDDRGRPVMMTAVLQRNKSQHELSWDVTYSHNAGELHQHITPGLEPVNYPNSVQHDCK